VRREGVLEARREDELPLGVESGARDRRENGVRSSGSAENGNAGTDCPPDMEAHWADVAALLEAP
jgi:hypothetical protein